LFTNPLAAGQGPAGEVNMNFSKYFAAFSILGTLTLSAPAWADIPPDDACMEPSLGKACYNAMVDGSLPTHPGTCQKAMCTRSTPDGPMTYDCFRCVANEEGSGGQSNEGGGGAGGEGKGGSAAGGSSNGSTAGKSSTGGSSAGTTSAAGAPTSPTGSSNDDDSDDGGCSVAQTPGAGRALGTGLLVLGLAFASIFRRRSHSS
jgi:MYXO-CTERM domain-containing protein